MSSVESAASETVEVNAKYKVMVTMSEQQYNDIQDLRGELRKLGIEKKIPSTASVTSRVFLQGLALSKVEVKEAKKAKVTKA